MNFIDNLIENSIDCYVEKILNENNKEKINQVWPLQYFRNNKNTEYFSKRGLHSSVRNLQDKEVVLVYECYKHIYEWKTTFPTKNPIVLLFLLTIHNKIWIHQLSKMNFLIWDKILWNICFLNIFISTSWWDPMMYSAQVWSDIEPLIKNNTDNFYCLYLQFYFGLIESKDSTYLLDTLDSLLDIDTGNTALLMHKARVLWALKFRETKNKEVLLQAEKIISHVIHWEENRDIEVYCYFWYGNILLAWEQHDKAYDAFKKGFSYLDQQEVLYAENYIFFLKLLLIKRDFKTAKKVLAFINKSEARLSADRNWPSDRNFLWKNFRYYIYVSNLFYFLQDEEWFRKYHIKSVSKYLNSKALAWNRNHFSFIFEGREYSFTHYSSLDLECEFAKKFMKEFQLLFPAEVKNEPYLTILFLAYLFCLKVSNRAHLIFNTRWLERGSFVYILSKYNTHADKDIMNHIMDLWVSQVQLDKEQMCSLLRNTPLYSLFFTKNKISV